MDINTFAQSLTPEMQQHLLQMLESYKSSSTRSPMPGPLKDLRDPSDPKKRIGRPQFDLRVHDSYTTPTEYPKVKYHQNGTDITVMSRAEESRLGPEYGDLPSAKALSTAELAQKEMDALSPEDQEMLRTMTLEAKLKRLQALMAECSPAELDTLMGTAEPAKRGPGRPRKADGDRP